MRLTLDLLGHRLDVRLDHHDDDQSPEQHDTTLNALVERNDPRMPAIGFIPPTEERLR